MSQKIIKVTTNDNKSYEYEYQLLEPCKFFQNRVNDREISVELSSQIFDKVLEHLKNLKGEKFDTIPEPLPEGKELKEIIKSKVYFDFISALDFELVFELINAGALLELDSLHDLACAKIAHFMKGKSPEEVNQHFTIECQLTNEEAKELGLDVDENQ